jgi:hypothetical protein
VALSELGSHALQLDGRAAGGGDVETPSKIVEIMPLLADEQENKPTTEKNTEQRKRN